LRFGVLLSGTLIFLGWIFKFRPTGNPFFNFQIYDRIPFSDLIFFYWDKKDWAMMISYAGLISLISLPLVRVIVLSILFFRQREYNLAMISFLVILLLFLSISMGLLL
jgi:uncharacterized membrane protein